ncbi:MAG: hypothetical protein LAO78_26790 [Acidobacteriia bacterium]|nr:hypothetical protein [Terriglobia bacterium]
MADYDRLGVMEAIQDSIASLDPGTWQYQAFRVVPIAIVVDAGPASKEFGDLLARQVPDILKKFGYGDIYTWGPFEGSLFITNFGKSKAPEGGLTFSENLQKISQEIAAAAARLPWKKYAAAAGGVIKIAVAVGTIVTILHGTPVDLSIAGIAISAGAWSLLRIAKEGVQIIESAKKIFLENDDARKAMEEVEANRPYDVSLKEDLRVGPPLKLRLPGT